MTQKIQNARAKVADAKPAAYVVRILVNFEEGGRKLKPNQLVVLGADRVEALEKEGRVSIDPAGIEWCAAEYPDVPVLDLRPVEVQPEGTGEGEQDSAVE